MGRSPEPIPMTCPECGAQQAEGLPQAGTTPTCTSCGARLPPPLPPPPRFSVSDYFSYSAFTIGVILIALGVPCLVGLVCLYLGR